jgi:hypothetical protein
MNDHYSETRRLSDAITALAATITEIMTGKLRAVGDGHERTLRGIGDEIALKSAEPLMTVKQLAKHLRITPAHG